MRTRMAVVSSLSSSVETTTTRTTTTKMTTTIQKTISTTTKRRCSIGTSSSSSSSSSTSFLSCVLGMVQVFFFVLLLTLFVVQVKGWMSWIPVSSSSSIPHRFGCGSCFCNVATISSWTTTTRTRITTTTTPIHSRRSCYPFLYCYSPNGREPNNDKNKNNNNKQPMLAALTSTYSNNNTTLSLSSSSWNRRQCLIATIGGGLVTTATVGTGNPPSCYAVPLKQPTTLLDSLQDNNNNENNDNHPIFSTTTSTTMAQEASTINRLPGEPRITDQIFLDIKGLPVSSSSSSSQDKKKDGSSTTVNNVVDDENNNNPMTQQQCRLVIGLYGDIAPQSVAKIKALVSTNGLPAICRPRVIKSLTKEQLEANKVYNSCIERQDQDGVTWKYSTIWRVIPNIRIDIGAVTGKFVAREYPNWIENEKKDDTMSRTTTTPSLEDDSSSLQNIPGLVSVRRGTESGFGITIATHGLVQEEESPKKIANNNNKNAGLSLLQSSMLLEDLHTNHIVVGRVLQDSMSIVQALNQVPVITTARQVNFMALTTTTTTNSGSSSSSTNKNAPNRSCQYGGNLYCNEYKPLIKLTVTNVGLVQ